LIKKNVEENSENYIRNEGQYTMRMGGERIQSEDFFSKITVWTAVTPLPPRLVIDRVRFHLRYCIESPQDYYLFSRKANRKFNI
jgi:hypothetical protein